MSPEKIVIALGIILALAMVLELGAVVYFINREGKKPKKE